MSYSSNQGNPSFASLAVATLLLILTFALIGFVSLSVVTGSSFGTGSPARANNAIILPDKPAGTPNPSDTVPLKSTVLGFSLEYPRSWRKNEQGLDVILSPSNAGLNPDNFQDAALWFAIPADGTTDPAELLGRLRATLAPGSQILGQETTVIGAASWQTVRLSFEAGSLGGPAMATIAATNQNEVGYFMVAVAPAGQWDALQPAFQSILGSFRFTTEAVLRPTDATPPPTPTATPTPVFYIVQSGDTLSKIALQYGVTIEALATRNNIDDPRSLRTGMKLIIPLKRR